MTSDVEKALHSQLDKARGDLHRNNQDITDAGVNVKYAEIKVQYWQHQLDAAVGLHDALQQVHDQAVRQMQDFIESKPLATTAAAVLQREAIERATQAPAEDDPAEDDPAETSWSANRYGGYSFVDSGLK